jgi:flagellar protein FliO/FliZ
MTYYILRVVIFLPLVAGLAWAALWLWRMAQSGLPGTMTRHRTLRLIDTLPLGAEARLVALEYQAQPLLIAVSRTGVNVISGQVMGGANEG